MLGLMWLDAHFTETTAGLRYFTPFFLDNNLTITFGSNIFLYILKSGNKTTLLLNVFSTQVCKAINW